MLNFCSRMSGAKEKCQEQIAKRHRLSCSLTLKTTTKTKQKEKEMGLGRL